MIIETCVERNVTMKKFNKTALTFATLQAGSVLSPLSNVSADTLNDVINKVKGAGLDVSVRDELVRVKSKAEADRLNVEADNQLQRDSAKVSAKIDQYLANKQRANVTNIQASERDKEINAQKARIQTIRDGNIRIKQANDEAIRDYNKRVSEIEARNAEKTRIYNEKIRAWEASGGSSSDYDAEVLRVQAENDKRLREYRDALNRVRAANAAILAAANDDAERIKSAIAANKAEGDRIIAANNSARDDYLRRKREIDDANAKALNKYNTDKQRIDAANAAARAKADADNTKADDDYRKALAAWEADKNAREKRHGDLSKAHADAVKAINDENRRIQQENDQVDRDNAKIDEENRKAREKYQTDVATITEQNKQIDKDNQKARDDYNALVSSVSTNGTNGKTMVTPDVYRQKLADYQSQIQNYVRQLEAYNAAERDYTVPRFLKEFGALFAENQSRALKNQSNMKFTGTAGVTYLKPIDTPVGSSLAAGVFNPYGYSGSSQTPVAGKVGNADVYAVRIPRGGSVTIEFTKKDGTNYLNKSDFKYRTRLVTLDKFNSKEIYEYNDPDFQGVKRVRLTITNDASITKDKDMVVYVANDMGIPIYYGVDGESQISGQANFSQPAETAQFLMMTRGLELFNEKDEPLRPVTWQYNTTSSDITSPTVDKPSLGFKNFITGKLSPFDNAPKYEFISVQHASTNDHGVSWTSQYEPAEDIPNKADTWRDTEAWRSEKYGFKDGKLLTQDSYHDNKLVTGVLSGKKGSQSFSVTGNDPKQPEKPKFGYTTTPEEPKPKDKLPLPKEPVDKPHKEKKPLKPILADPTEPLVIPEKPKPKDHVTPKIEEVPTKPTLVTPPEAPKLKDIPGPKKVVPNAPDVTLQPEPKVPTLLPKPPKPSNDAVRPPEPVYEDIPKAPRLTPVKPITEKDLDVIKKFGEPEKPVLELQHTRYVYINRTIWETSGGEVLKPWLDGELPKDDFDGYTFIKTIKDNNGDTHHIYNPNPSPKVIHTIWETDEGRVLKPWETGRQPKQDFDGYTYLKTVTDKDGNIHHIYKPIASLTIDKPQISTIWVDDKGNVLKPRQVGEHPKENFDGYEFIQTSKDKDGNIVHVYKTIPKPSISTSWVDDNGNPLKPSQNGEHPKDNVPGYTYVRTEKDINGNTKHIYHKTPKVTTSWVDEEGNPIRPTKDGEHPKDDIPGYTFVRSERDKDGNIKHIYRKNAVITTSWVDEHGNPIKPPQEGDQPHGELPGYRYKYTVRDKNGNVKHVFEKITTTEWVDEQGNPLKPKAEGELPKEMFDGYIYLRTDKDADGHLKHVYQKAPQLTTSFVDMDGQPIRPTKLGVHDKEDIPGYTFVQTTKDKDGNILHMYKKSPVVITSFVDEVGKQIIPSVTGSHDKKDIPGYEFVKTTNDENGNVTHVYKKTQSVTTRWVDESDKDLKPLEVGTHRHAEFAGYEFVKSVRDKNGNVKHYYKVKTHKPGNVTRRENDDKLTYHRPTESPKQLPKTGDSSLFSMLVGGALASVGVVNLKQNKKKNRK